MSLLKNVFRSIAATAIVTGLFKGVEALSDAYGVRAKMVLTEGRVEVTKGFFSSSARVGVQGAVADLGITNGWIEVRNSGLVAFSDTFPATVHQRLRNIVLNA